MMKKLFIPILIGALLLVGGGAMVNKMWVTPSSENVAEESSTTMHKSGSLKSYPYEALLNDAPVIVKAHTVDISNPFKIKSVNGSISRFTDYTVQADEVYRGQIATGDSVVVRIEGGCIDGNDVVVDEAPSLKMDEEVVLFLYQPNMGSGFNTEGDYYYVLGMTQGAFYPKVQDDKLTADYVNKFGTTFSLDRLQSDITSMDSDRLVVANRENRVYEEFLNNQKANLESGMITQEEYDRFLQEAQTYATIVK